MTLLDVSQKYGHSRNTLTIGDKVLLEGSNSTKGTYVFLCEVIAVTGDSVRLCELETYDLSGGVFPRSGEMDRPIAYFKHSIATRLLKQNEFLSWLVEELRK